ncbi:MAG: hypothetical protein ACIALR_00235 [Blastopirellula sp. JB062]
MTRRTRNGGVRFAGLFASLAGVALCVASGGCAQQDDGMVKVAGQVTFDGQPVEVGEVRFSVDGHATEASPIVMGQYETRVPRGKAEVAIVAYRETRGTQMAVTGTAPMNENYIPPIYNANTTLSVDIAKADQALDFALNP